MTREMLEAHQRLLARLPVRTHIGKASESRAETRGGSAAAARALRRGRALTATPREDSVAKPNRAKTTARAAGERSDPSGPARQAKRGSKWAR